VASTNLSREAKQFKAVSVPINLVHLPHLESNYRLRSLSRLVCASVGRIAILGHLSARCIFYLLRGYAGPAGRTYMFHNMHSERSTFDE